MAATRETKRQAAVGKTRTSFKTATFDARPDRLDFRDLQYRPPLRSLAPQFPNDASIEEYLPGYVRAKLVLDQGQEGACTGFGLACVINYLLWVRHVQAGGKGAFAQVSPRMLYELARRYDEWPGEQYEGSSCRGALKGWHKHGVCAEAYWPYRTDAGEARVTPPRKGWDADAVRRPLGVYYRVNKRSLVDMQAAVQEIGAVYVSARVHDGWDRLPAKPAPRSHADLPLIGAPRDQRVVGGHAFAIVGYNERGFIVQNSWGVDWGARGFAVMSYSDWVAYGTDAWAVALGVPQDLSPERIEALRWPARSGRSLGFFDLKVRNPDNPPDDPWPFDRVYAHRPYQPWSTANAYAHTLVTGNDGRLVLTDLIAGASGGIEPFMERLLVDRPAAWLVRQTRPKVMVYAHGGLNDEDASIARIRVMAPYFEANGIYPLFLTWRTGPGETIVSMLEDKFRSFFGVEDEAQMRAAGFLDDLADSRDRRVEELAQRVLRGLWTEMRENAARGAAAGHGLDLLARNLARLRDELPAKSLEVHLVGHSAGSIVLGHLLPHLAAPRNGRAPVRVASCSLYAAACSVGFAVEKYLEAGRSVLRSQDIALHYLSDRNEKADYLAGLKGLHLYGKSLLYLVSRALDDARKIPLLGFERAVEPGWHRERDKKAVDQWAASRLELIRAWQAGFKGTLHRVDTPSVPVDKTGKTQQARHGSFDNNIAVITATLERIAAKKVVKPLEWLDY